MTLRRHASPEHGMQATANDHFEAENILYPGGPHRYSIDLTSDVVQHLIRGTRVYLRFGSICFVC